MVPTAPNSDAAWKLYEAGKLAEAEALLLKKQAAIGLDGESLWILGCIAYEAGDFFSARQLFEQAITALPNDARPYNSLGRTFMAFGEHKQAIALFERALTLDPGLPICHLNLAEALLASAHWRRGWEEYEWRFLLPDTSRYFQHIPLPEHKGTAIPGERIMVIGDQGYGDCFQFARYLPRLASMGVEVVLGCAPELLRLMERIPGLTAITTDAAMTQGASAFIPLSKLGLLTNAKPDIDACTVPYLPIDPDMVSKWAQRLEGTGIKVGLVWTGRPRPNPRRSIPFPTVQALLDVPGIRFISLQKGSCAVEFEGRVEDFDALLTDFAETAALISNLDLVVTIDTAVAHLAGALGVPVWVLLPFESDWRWMHGHANSPWYPTARLFRQPRPGAWRPVVTDVKSALAGFTPAKRSPSSSQ